MLNLFRKILRPTLRQQLEDGVREALRRYADRRVAPDLRVFVSTDLVPPGMNLSLFARDEADHLRRFAAQWAQDNGIARAGLRVEVVLLDTKREFAFVKPLGLEPPPPAPERASLSAASVAPGGERSLVPESHRPTATAAPGGRGGAVLEVVHSETVRDPVAVDGELVVGRRPEPGVFALGDRYMSGRHARFRAGGGRLTVTDLDSKNRTYVNENPIPPHQERALSPGDTVRMGNTVLRVARLD
ncbi:MAG TPA: FHA domain-containing protein [Longimicrobiaceae bacterium]|nr:FHA domain-containing protein [Longimicrobiaceae bacterium]